MDTTPKKSNKTRSVTKVSSVAEFKKWVNQISGQTILFRGMANTRWHVESSLYRRLKLNGLKHVDDDMFLEMTKVLINRARRSQHGMKKGCKLNDLKVLVNLQHYGAATCMIDFTKKPLVALFFACETAHNKKNKEVDGKVVAFNSDNADSYDEISIENSDEKIEYWLQNNKLWVLPAKKQNNRAASQKSVFVFGNPTLSAQNFRACKITNKKEILDELKEKEDISAETLFDDIAGFSALHSHNKKYENWDTDSDFVSGRLCQASGNFETAIQYYDKEIKSDPKSYASYNNRGVAKHNLGKSQEALSDFNYVLKFNPNDSFAYSNRGIAKDKLGDLQDALNDFNKAVRLSPKSSEAYNHRGAAKNKLNNPKDAINDLNKAIELNPKNYHAHNNRGIIEGQLCNFQDAIRSFNKAIKLNPNSFKPYKNRGFAKINLGNFQDAINDLDKAIRLNPNSFKAYYDRGFAKYKLEKIQDAISDFNDAIRLNPEYYEAYYHRGLAKIHLDNFQDAISDFNDAIRLNPKNYKAYYNRGLAKNNSGNIKGAVADFDKVKKLNPKIEIPNLSSNNSDK